MFGTQSDPIDALSREDVVKFYVACGDLVESIEQALKGNFFKAFQGMMSNIGFIRRNAATAIGMYNSFTDAEKEVVQREFNQSFDLENDKIEMMLEAVAFKAVQIAEWVSTGMQLIPQVIGILSLKDLFTRKK